MRDKLALSFRIIEKVSEKRAFFNIKELSRDDFFSTIGFHIDKTWELRGKVVSGAQEASFFTQLDWVQEQCIEKLGFRPYPGTLNLSVEVFEESRDGMEELCKEQGVQLVPPNPEFCPAKMLPVHIGRVRGAIVIPSKDVNIHTEDIIEVMAPLKLRDALGVKDGDVVTLVIDRYRYRNSNASRGG